MAKNKKIENKKRIVIGMTGRLESTICAFLLKKQGYDCLGVAVLFIDEKRSEDMEKTNFITEPLANIAQICQFLEIPFYAVDAQEQFESEVMSQIVVARIGGISYSTPILANELLLKILAEKAVLLKADGIATGHFAKVHHNHATNENFLLASPTITQDQSHLLSTVPTETLKKLVLPLADIGEKEVFKIAALIREEVELKSGKELQLDLDEDFIQDYLEKNVPNSLREDGDIIHYKEETSICSHEGTYLYRLGQNELIGSDGQKIDPKLTLLKVQPSRGSLFVDRIDSYGFTGCFLRGKNLSLQIDQSRPLAVLVKVLPSMEMHKAIFYYKTFNHFTLQFEQELDGLFAGQQVVVYQQLANTLKVFSHGQVFDASNYEFYDRLYAKPDEDSDDDETIKFLKLKSKYGYYF